MLVLISGNSCNLRNNAGLFCGFSVESTEIADVIKNQFTSFLIPIENANLKSFEMSNKAKIIERYSWKKR